MTDSRASAIIVAGGSGERMGASVPKQFLSLCGRPLILYALETFQRSGNISEIIVVCHQQYLKDVEKITSECNISKISEIVPGGATRQESSYIGVRKCSPGTEYVLIHDAVRPFVSEKMIDDVLRAAEDTGASTVAVDVSDTIVNEKNGLIHNIPERSSMRRVQTPQGFKYALITEAHQWAREKGVADMTDDCGLILKMGGKVRLVPGSGTNIKVTNREDLVFAEGIITAGYKDKN